ncbi:MAG: hypothetical protein J6X81_00970 [Muribaculaceae bacterium]|nr:hypothetical protein [Muribaculaceae bacterium]
MIKAGIIGKANRQTKKLFSILLHHPDVEVKALICPEYEGARVDRVFRELVGETDLVFGAINTQELDVIFIRDDADIEKAGEVLKNLREDAYVISGIRTALESTPYITGIAELNRKLIVRDTHRVFSPHATTIAGLLGLLPLAKNLLLSGTVKITFTGGSREFNDNETKTEIETALSSLQSSFNSPLEISFMKTDDSSDLLMEASVDCRVAEDVLRELYEDYYDDHNFTFLVNEVNSGDARGTNKCFISLKSDGSRLLLRTTIDSEIKGDVGNCVHLMNLLFGLHERVGLMLNPC